MGSMRCAAQLNTAGALVARFLLVFAQAFRRGAELAQDTEGLV